MASLFTVGQVTDPETTAAGTDKGTTPIIKTSLSQFRPDLRWDLVGSDPADGRAHIGGRVREKHLSGLFFQIGPNFFTVGLGARKELRPHIDQFLPPGALTSHQISVLERYQLDVTFLTFGFQERTPLTTDAKTVFPRLITGNGNQGDLVPPAGIIKIVEIFLKKMVQPRNTPGVAGSYSQDDRIRL